MTVTLVTNNSNYSEKEIERGHENQDNGQGPQRNTATIVCQGHRAESHTPHYFQLWLSGSTLDTGSGRATRK